MQHFELRGSDMNLPTNTHASACDTPSAQKQPYTPPVLVSFGHIADITLAGAISTTSDSGMNSMRIAM